MQRLTFRSVCLCYTWISYTRQVQKWHDVGCPVRCCSLLVPRRISMPDVTTAMQACRLMLSDIMQTVSERFSFT